MTLRATACLGLSASLLVFVAACSTPIQPQDAASDGRADAALDATRDAPLTDAPLDLNAHDIVADSNGPDVTTSDASPLDAIENDSPADVPIDDATDASVDDIGDVPLDDAGDASMDVPADDAPDTAIDVPVDVGPECLDADGDGYSTCDGDCDDGVPEVNPGAYDFANGIDDDCDGTVDNAVTDCSAGLAYTSSDALDYARAIDLCETTTLGAAGAARRSGLISAQFRLANGTGAPALESHAIVTSFGSALVPRRNANFVLLSTGRAAAPGQPYFVTGTPEPGSSMGTSSPLPSGFPTNKIGCAVPSTTGYDPVNLVLTIRVPTNAHALAFDSGFFSAEYPEWTCSARNDAWVALLASTASGIPSDRNIVFDAQMTIGSVNLNFLDRCVAGATGCFSVPGFNFCSGGRSELAGTGYGDPDAPCGSASSIGGGTGWLTTEAPVVPGEVITLQLVIWDSSDATTDSTVMLDNFRWLAAPRAAPVTHR